MIIPRVYLTVFAENIDRGSSKITLERALGPNYKGLRQAYTFIKAVYDCPSFRLINTLIYDEISPIERTYEFVGAYVSEAVPRIRMRPA